jgi:flagellar biosynthetic protein FliR
MMLIFTRAGALFMAVPVLGGISVPVELRVALGIAISVVLVPLVPAVPLMNPGLLIVAMLFEMLVGLLMGMAVHGVFATIEFAADTIANEIGLMRSETLNPMSESGKGGEVGTMLFFFGLMVFLTMGMHHDVILALVRSYDALPAGSLMTGGFSLDALTQVTGQLFVVGVLMSAPFIAVNFLINMTFALLGKVAPKMNVFMTSFSFRILAGLFTLITTLTLLAHYISAQFDLMPSRMFDLLLGVR